MDLTQIFFASGTLHVPGLRARSQQDLCSAQFVGAAPELEGFDGKDWEKSRERLGEQLGNLREILRDFYEFD